MPRLPQDQVSEVEEVEKLDSRAEENEEIKPEINFARLVVIGVTILGFPEKMVWRKTLRRLMNCTPNIKSLMGIENGILSPDDVIPGEDVI